MSDVGAALAAAVCVVFFVAIVVFYVALYLALLGACVAIFLGIAYAVVCNLAGLWCL